MILPRISIQRPVLASMMSLALVLFGLIGLQRLPVRELPDIDPPIVSVTTVYPGANAQVVETEVTERLEEAVNNIEGIKTLSSQSREQSARSPLNLISRATSSWLLRTCPTVFRACAACCPILLMSRLSASRTPMRFRSSGWG